MLSIFRLSAYVVIAFIFMFITLVARDLHARPWQPDNVDGSGNGIYDNRPRPKAEPAPARPHSDVALVVASMKADDTTWVDRYLPYGWRAHKYVVDDPYAPLTVPANKGREAMVYLTHIIDTYHDDDAPPYVVFVHASRFAWHNDDPDYDAVPTLRNLQLNHVREEGYVNLRCVWAVGCPAEIRPYQDEGLGSAEKERVPTAKRVYKAAWGELMHGEPAPEVVAVSCCSQFAVTREMIRSRPLADYVHFRDWLLETPLDDSLSGRVLEFSWHIIFGKEAVHCPSAEECYCKTFGICDIACDGGSCEERYTLPKYSILPPGWPLRGWEQEERDFTGPLD